MENKPYLVQKFGGTSLSDIEHIRRAANYVIQAVESGYQVAVVVSAMAGVTNQLAEWITETCPGNRNVRSSPESDAVLASGEQVTAGLLSLVLQNMGLKARSWMGWQLPIVTTDHHGRAQIINIQSDILKNQLSAGEVAVISGFQGVTPQGRITTLGRGGSDTTAVALAATLGAARCDIYTDVEGVYTADPRWVDDAEKIDSLSYESMSTLASQGAKVLHPASVDLAKTHKVPLRILSSLAAGHGTWVVPREDAPYMVNGVIHTFDCVQMTLKGLSFHWTLDQLQRLLIENNVNFDMLTTRYAFLKKTQNTSFIVAREDIFRAASLLKQKEDDWKFQSLEEYEGLAKLSLTRSSHQNSLFHLRQKMLKVLAAKKVDIHGISTSPFRISVLIGQSYVHKALNALHQACVLQR